MSGTLIPEAWGRELLRETLVADFHSPLLGVSRERAEEVADKLIAEGRAMDYLEATRPKPCECCGETP